MPKKKADKETIDIVRKILDNPSELVPTDNKYLETLRCRVKRHSRYYYSPTIQKQPPSSPMQPTVTIHHVYHERIKPDSTEKQSVQSISDYQPKTPFKHDFYKQDEDIFEIEHVEEQDIPFFIEVKPKEQQTLYQTKPEKEPTITEEITETPPPQLEKNEEQATPLPKWELVEDEPQITEERKPEEPETQIQPDQEIPQFKEPQAPEKTKQEIPEQKELETKAAEEELQEDNEAFITSDEKEEEIRTIWEPVESSEPERKEEPEKKPFFQKVSKEKPSHVSHEKEESPFLVQELKQSIKKLHPKSQKQAFQYKGYTLYQKEIDLGNNKKRVIHFFSKEKPDDSVPSILPDNYEVKINKNTGVPYIRRKES